MSARLPAVMLLVVFGATVHAAEVTLPPWAGMGERTATMVLHRNLEMGTQPDISRTLITASFIRIDNGSIFDDYVLVDRIAGVIYSVSHDALGVLMIVGQPVTTVPPFPMTFGGEVLGDREPLQVAGREAPHYRLYANAAQCYDVVAAEGLLPDVLDATAEYRALLAGQHAFSLDAIPEDLLNPCDLSMNIFAPDEYLQWGLPVEEWDTVGVRKFMVDYVEGYPVDAGLFSVPGYEAFSPGEF